MEETFEREIPKESVGRVIGTKGRNINKIKAITGAFIEMQEANNIHLHEWVLIKGTKEQIAKANSEINIILQNKYTPPHAVKIQTNDRFRRPDNIDFDNQSRGFSSDRRPRDSDNQSRGFSSDRRPRDFDNQSRGFSSDRRPRDFDNRPSGFSSDRVPRRLGSDRGPRRPYSNNGKSDEPEKKYNLMSDFPGLPISTNKTLSTHESIGSDSKSWSQIAKPVLDKPKIIEPVNEPKMVPLKLRRRNTDNNDQ